MGEVPFFFQKFEVVNCLKALPSRKICGFDP